jgi:hypothetical protein
VLVAGAVIALATGCGDEPVATTISSGREPLSKAEFLQEADRICFAVESKIEAALDNYATGGRKPDPAEVRRVALGIVVPKLRSEADTIRLLEPPPEDAAKIEAILEATERGADQIEADPAAAVDRVPSGLREAERLARAYGSQQCGIR